MYDNLWYDWELKKISLELHIWSFCAEHTYVHSRRWPSRSERIGATVFRHTVYTRGWTNSTRSSKIGIINEQTAGVKTSAAAAAVATTAAASAAAIGVCSVKDIISVYAVP